MKTLAFAVMTSSWFIGHIYLDAKRNLEEGGIVAYSITLILFVATCIIAVSEK